jgi:hypothetical protein
VSKLKTQIRAKDIEHLFAIGYGCLLVTVSDAMAAIDERVEERHLIFHKEMREIEATADARAAWRMLDLIADLGEADTELRSQWGKLICEHGFDAVIKACAARYWLVYPRGVVSIEICKDALVHKSTLKPSAQPSADTTKGKT